jgi:hypothetical protein
VYQKPALLDSVSTYLNSARLFEKKDNPASCRPSLDLVLNCPDFATSGLVIANQKAGIAEQDTGVCYGCLFKLPADTLNALLRGLAKYDVLLIVP